MNYTAVIGFATASMMLAALSTALKHRSAGDAPEVSFSLRRIGAFLKATVRHPLWLGGILSDIGALAMQVIALHYGALSVVQPMLAVTVLFALIFAHFISGTPLTWREGGVGIVLVASVISFLVVSGATSAPNPVSPAHHIRAFIAGAILVLAVLGCLWWSRHADRGRRGALLGCAVGLLYAATAVLIKACSDRLQQGPIHLILSWELYAWIACGACALFLAQAALQRGALSAVVGGTAAVDPLASVALGVAVYDEELRSTPIALFGEVTSLAVLAISVVALARMAAARERFDPV
ncbi:hypothetical protein G9U51_14935 [Calidifontibacter sp. DB0510]|uniref:DMT family transporter n=1 Tax=Metallococcus carri TaxID=1656884 RepID=A0A967EBK8_9MICO|nr:DMT family transporter [Metallococcus carri]NHN57064.1 hypothetical protein [Metallococcus carri]NOP39067.1 DMT family transporter [Calidifontibacter sp. DB2511S]